MKAKFNKQKPKNLNCRNYKFFNHGTFQNDLLHQIHLKGAANIGCKQFEHLFLATLDKYAPQKKRFVRVNNSPFVTDELYKCIMVKSKK